MSLKKIDKFLYLLVIEIGRLLSMFRSRIIDLFEDDSISYSLNHFREKLRNYRDEFTIETGNQLTNKFLRKYVSKMVGKGLSVTKDGELNVYSFDPTTASDKDLKRFNQNRIDKLFPDDFDFDEIDEKKVNKMSHVMKEFNIDEWGFDENSKLVILTGAGISAESGIDTFRDIDGLWENHSIDDVATPEGFERNPELVVKFYNERRAQLKTVEPNSAHVALAKLQEHLGDRCFLITQNVDDLHSRGGSKQVNHMHGELNKLRCNVCEYSFEYTEEQSSETQCPACESSCRPHVVWFGEMPFDMNLLNDKVEECTHFVYIGTSSIVYPAAGFKIIAKEKGAKVLCINLEVEVDTNTDFYLKGYAGNEVPKFVDQMVGG